MFPGAARGPSLTLRVFLGETLWAGWDSLRFSVDSFDKNPRKLRDCLLVPLMDLLFDGCFEFA